MLGSWSCGEGTEVYKAVVFQNIPQLVNLYGQGLWEIILGDCDYWLVLGGVERSTAAYVSDILGHTSVRKVTEQRPKGIMKWLDPWEGRETEGVERAPLMNLSEVTRLGLDECLVRVSAGRVVKLKKLPYWRHPLYRELEPAHVLEYRPAWAESWREEPGEGAGGPAVRRDERVGEEGEGRSPVLPGGGPGRGGGAPAPSGGPGSPSGRTGEAGGEGFWA
ncbi:TraM recognition domain-containing protein [Ammonifex degensii]|uniref:TraM recognition domain-containing protein n=1 Tax=Ammonifex degensii TaxID=42838 RepID=UPI0002F0CF75|nr:TraM recognition domain-containing protein [Ammonifex degensii]